jgi:hypothetical protein
MIGHLAENPPRFLGRRESKGQWREKWLNLAVESEFHSFRSLRPSLRLCTSRISPHYVKSRPAAKFLIYAHASGQILFGRGHVWSGRDLRHGRERRARLRRRSCLCKLAAFLRLMSLRNQFLHHESALSLERRFVNSEFFA